MRRIIGWSLILGFIVFGTVMSGGIGFAVALLVMLPFIYIVENPKKKKPVDRRRAGYDFEHWCARYLEKHGFRNVQVTPASGDYGADIIARDKRGNVWVFQCKYYGHSVGNSAVQEVVGAKLHYGANCAGVMTNSRLTKQARELAEDNAVAIIEGLSDW